MVLRERPTDAPAQAQFDESRFRRDFSDVLEIRKVSDPAVGVAATAFIRTDPAHEEEFERILHLDMHNYMTVWDRTDKKGGIPAPFFYD